MARTSRGTASSSSRARPTRSRQSSGSARTELSELVARARQRLYAARDKRVHPGLDDKVLASWNGLALSAFAEAGRALGRPDYVAAAVDNGRFLTTSMMDGGRLMRSWKDGRARIKGYLEDYAMVGAGLVSLYEATFDRRWLDESRRLAEAALGLFWDAERDAFFDTGADHEALIVRPRNIFDNAVPSGASVAIDWLLRLARRARRGAVRGARARGAAADGRSDDALSVGLRAVSLGARLPPGPRGRGRPRLARGRGSGGRSHCSTSCSPDTCPIAWWPPRPRARRSKACHYSPSASPWAAGPPRMSAAAMSARLPVTTPEALGRQLEGVYSESPTRGEVS